MMQESLKPADWSSRHEIYAESMQDSGDKSENIKGPSLLYISEKQVADTLALTDLVQPEV